MESATVSAFSAAVTSTVKLTEKVFEIRAVDKQAKNLVELINQLNTQLDLAKTIRRQKSSLLTREEKKYMDDTFNGTASAIGHVATLVEPCRVALRTSNGNIGLGTRLMFVLRDSPRIQVTLTSLGIASQTLNTVVGILFAKQGTNNAPLVRSYSDQVPPPPSYAESTSLMESKRGIVRQKFSTYNSMGDILLDAKLSELERDGIFEKIDQQEGSLHFDSKAEADPDTKDELFFSSTSQPSLSQSLLSPLSPELHSSGSYVAYRPGLPAHVTLIPGHGHHNSTPVMADGFEETRRRMSEIPCKSTSSCVSSRISPSVFQVINAVPNVDESRSATSALNPLLSSTNRNDDIDAGTPRLADTSQMILTMQRSMPEPRLAMPGPERPVPTRSSSSQPILRKQVPARRVISETRQTKVVAESENRQRNSAALFSDSIVSYTPQVEELADPPEFPPETSWMSSGLAPQPLFQKTALPNVLAHKADTVQNILDIPKPPMIPPAMANRGLESEFPEVVMFIPEEGLGGLEKGFFEFSPDSAPEVTVHCGPELAPEVAVQRSPEFAPEVVHHHPSDSAPELAYHRTPESAPEVVPVLMAEPAYIPITPEIRSSTLHGQEKSRWSHLPLQDIGRSQIGAPVPDSTRSGMSSPQGYSRSQAVSPLSTFREDGLVSEPQSVNFGRPQPVSSLPSFRECTQKPNATSPILEAANWSPRSRTVSDADSIRSLNLTPVSAGSVPTGRARSQRWREAQYERFEKLQTRHVP